MTATKSGPAFYGWRMVGLGFLAYNIGLTVVINAFGPALPVLERELGASRGEISMAFGLLMLALGVLAPLFGSLTRWVKLRTLMMAGSAINAVGFLALAFSRDLPQVLFLYGAVIGTGSCMMAIIATPSLISRWFEKDRGKALGIGLVQVFGLFTAPLAAWLVSTGGRHLLFLTLAVVFALLTPLLALVIDRPEDVGQTPRRAPDAQPAPTGGGPLKATREIFLDRRFWLLSLVMGVMTTAGVTFSSHSTAMVAAKGASLTVSSLPLAACGAGALCGSIGFGWLADRIGPFRALVGAILLCLLSWAIFAAVPVIPVLIGMGAVLGVSMGATVTLQSACLNDLYGSANFSRVMGYSYLIKVPFMFAPAPLAGYLYDMSGGYGSSYLTLICVLGAATLVALVMAFDGRRAAASAAPA